MIEREEACLRSWGASLAAGRPAWMVEVSILEEHLLTDIEVAFAERINTKALAVYARAFCL
ncbi:hypothetical protein, partial [Shewanella mangrovisoli]|uniref:hypothetical protein n=1 Tax=Shewanella mangrovisoli TaxID=2864211 RepID=UPI00370CAA7D